MGEYADDVIEGRVCQFCTVFLCNEEDQPGHPVTCEACEGCEVCDEEEG